MHAIRLWSASLLCSMGLFLMTIGIIGVTPRTGLAMEYEPRCNTCGYSCPYGSPPCKDHGCGGGSCPTACTCQGDSAICNCAF
jgi:hypothetical protein